jgi:MmyB-like transcription regulator ligand binding domain
VKTSTWDIVAWNRAASAVLIDYGAIAVEQRNILRLIFCDHRIRALQLDWESVARFAVAAFRADAVRTGAAASVKALVDESASAAPNSKRCGVTMTFVRMAKARNICDIRLPDRSRWNIRLSPSIDDPISAW